MGWKARPLASPAPTPIVFDDEPPTDGLFVGLVFIDADPRAFVLPDGSREGE
jgi:hypothetical protein